jgi:F-type H+-transporting ATPase subunit delta
MSEVATVARPYAQATFDLAKATGTLSQWSDMLAFAAAVSCDAGMREAIDNPNLTIEQRAEVFNAVCADQLDDAGRNLVRLLAENGRLAVLPEIAGQFEKLRAEAEKTLEATVISAQELSDAQQQQIADAIKARFGREVKLQLEMDPSLIGGAIIRAGDTVIDGSARGRLESFTNALG